MIPLENRLLGRLPSPHDPRTLRLWDFFPKVRKEDGGYKIPRAANPPDERRWDAKIKEWGVMGNDSYGNCTIVTAAHAILSWRANELNDSRRITDSAVIDLSRIMGATNGYNILERLKYWRKTGMWATKIWAFAMIRPQDQLQVMITVNEFGIADIGLNLPRAWQDAEIWDIGSSPAYRPGSWGGHSVPIVGYDNEFVYVVTWGDVQQMTWAGLKKYCDEAYAIISPEWLAGDAVSPSGFDLKSLHLAMKVATA
jgi:hypothetical protein